MRLETRTALGELGFAWGDAQAALARYEQEGTAAAMLDAARRLDRLRDQLGIVKSALRLDADSEPMPVTEVSDEMVGRVLAQYHRADPDKIKTTIELALGLRQPVLRDAA